MNTISGPWASVSAEPDTTRGARPPWVGIAVIAAAAFGLEMAVSARYGYARDELYFLAAGHHLAFGYVDQPPLTPLLARFAAAAAGNTLAGLRVLPALGLSVLVVATAAMSRWLGAGRTGQLLAALAAATCGEFLGAMHELTTTAPDFVFWTVTLLLVMRLLASEDPRWWVAIGGCVGIASEAKWNIGFLAAAVAWAPPGRHRCPPPAAQPLPAARRGDRGGPGGAGPRLAGPARLAQPGRVPRAAGRGRAQPGRLLARAGPLHRPGGDPGLGDRGDLVAAQRGGPALPAGGDRLRHRDRAAVRAGRQGVLPGCGVHVPDRGGLGSARAPAGRPAPGQAGRLARLVRPAAATAAAMLAGAVLAAPVALSALPARTLHTVPLQKINYDLAETIAWPRLVALVAREYRSLPGPATAADRHRDRELRRGGRDRPLRARARPAAGLQRRQQLLAVGPAARGRSRSSR